MKTLRTHLVSRLNNHRLRANYYDIREETDLFPDASLLESIDSDQKEAGEAGIEEMLTNSTTAGTPNQQCDSLRQCVMDNKDVFHTSSSGPPAIVHLLKIDVSPDGRLVRVRLRKYSQGQRELLAEQAKAD